MQIHEYLEKIINNLNIPIVIINQKTKEYEWMNNKALEIMQTTKIDFQELKKTNVILNSQLYQLKQINLEKEKQAIILEPINESFIDNETELLNFRGFFIKYETLYSILKRKKKEFALALIEIDEFENLVNRFSYHQAVSIFFKISEILKSKIRQNIDILSRFNIKCFLLFLSEVDMGKTHKILNRLQKSVLEYCKRDFPFILTISVVSTIIQPSLQDSNQIMEELNNLIQKLMYTMEYEKKLKQNFVIIT
ncbi:MAG: GGDEF domain-containing protein [bacterium]